MFLVFKTAAKPSNLELKFGFVPGRTKLMRLSFGMENKRDANAMDIQWVSMDTQIVPVQCLKGV